MPREGTFRAGASGDNPDRVKDKKNTFLRDKGTIERLRMYRSGKAIRNKAGRIVGGSFLMRTRAGDKEITGATGRIAPDRRWFGNTRVVGPEDLDRFREEMTKRVEDPYAVLLKAKKLPMGLLAGGNARENEEGKMRSEVTAETFKETFSAKKRRKRPALARAAGSLEALAAQARTRGRLWGEHVEVSVDADTPIPTGAEADRLAELEKATADAVAAAEGGVGGSHSLTEATKEERPAQAGMSKAEAIFSGKAGEEEYSAARERLFDKGTSRRLWGELYKVIDCSDVVLEVLDARDPEGTRCRRVERFLKKEKKHKHLVLILNKADLVPTWVTRRWVRALSREYPTLAFHASIEKPFGKGALIHLLRQFAHLHRERREISVGFVGYPNVGKSALINALRGKNVCKAAPIPGHTKVWQYVSLMKRVSLIDCPGVVAADGTDSRSAGGLAQESAVLRGVVRAEKLEAPEEFLPAIVARASRDHLEKTYGVKGWNSAEEFGALVARKMGKLRKGGVPDLKSVAVIIINDWQRGRIPWWSIPPDTEATVAVIGKKRSRADIEAANQPTPEELQQQEEEEEELQEEEEESEEEEEEDEKTRNERVLKSILKKQKTRTPTPDEEEEEEEEEEEGNPFKKGSGWDNLDLEDSDSD